MPARSSRTLDCEIAARHAWLNPEVVRDRAKLLAMVRRCEVSAGDHHFKIMVPTEPIKKWNLALQHRRLATAASGKTWRHFRSERPSAIEAIRKGSANS